MPLDKKKHIAAGFIIGLIGTVFCNALIGFGLAVIAGIAKEILDKISGRGVPEGLDCLCTSCGGLLATTIIYILKLAWQGVQNGLH